MLQRATKLIKIQLLILFLLAGCTRLKQCAYEGFSRDQWQQRDRVVESLQIHAGDRVADIGSGGGYFVFAFAKAVGPDGKVFAVDVDEEMNDLVAQRARKEGIGNVEVILAKPDDPCCHPRGRSHLYQQHLSSHR
jgi:predicted methyltransferase